MVKITKNTFIKLTTASNTNLIDKFYPYFIQYNEEYGVINKNQIAAFLINLGVETNGLKDTENLSSTNNYKKRGLFKIEGEKQYQEASNILNRDFINEPDTVAPSLLEIKTYSGSNLKYENAILTSFYVWNSKGLNSVANNLDLNYDIEESDNEEFFTQISTEFSGNTQEKITIWNEYRNDVLKDNYKEQTKNDVNSTEEGEDEEDVPESDVPEREGENRPINDSLQQPISGITNIFKPTIKLDPIQIPMGKNSEKAYTDIGYTPFIWYNDIQLDLIVNFILESTEFLPIIKFKFVDRYGQVGNLRFPNDDSKITLFLRPKNDNLREIFMEFKIVEFHKLADSTYIIKGISNVNYMLITQIESYNSMSSYEALMEIAKKSGLGFSTNINQTNDNMTWVNPAKTGKMFVKHILDHSYISDSSFTWAYIDVFYNLVYIDVEKQLKMDLSKQIGINSTNMSAVLEKLKKSKNEDVGLMYLTNDAHAEFSENYYSQWKILNNSTKISIEKGYLHRTIYYDSNNKKLLSFDIDSLTDSSDNLNSLKGSEDKFFYNNNSRFTYFGKIDNDNVHENFHYAKVQNDHNLKNLQKIGMEIILNSPNYNLYRFQIIYNLMINQGIDSKLNPALTEKLSGKWLITEISYIYSEGSLKQKIKLLRRNLGLSEIESYV